MRAVFTLDLPVEHDKPFPSTLNVLQMVRRFGWEFQNIDRLIERDIRAIVVAQGTNTETSSKPEFPAERKVGTEDSQGITFSEADAEQRLQAHYRRLAAPLFEDMPEVASAELNYVIFLGYVSDDQTLFVITRLVPGQITFRLLHRELPRLQSSTEKLIRKLIGASLDSDSNETPKERLKERPLRAANPLIVIYERNFDHVILNGRIITSSFDEARRTNLKDFLLFVVPFFLFVPAAYVVVNFPPAQGTQPMFWYSTLDRGSTALLTAALVSGLGFVHTWIQIAKTKLIDWKFATDARGYRD